MDEEERFSAASSPESERPNEAEAEAEAEAEPDADADADEAMDDADDGDDDDENNNDEDNDADDTQKSGADAGADPAPNTPTLSEFKRRLRPSIRPEAVTARVYDIVPTMAAPQATSVNCLSITPDLRYWMTGGSDGYIRKYDGPGTINGKLALTVAQKHPFVDSVTKAGILMSYWENEEPPAPGRDAEHNLSPVYALAVHSEALWLLSGLESGGINLQSVRHDEGKKITCLQKHTNAVSSLMLAPDELSVLSGGWDKNIFDWDLNSGSVIRSFDGTGGQISGIELRPASGAPVPAEADDEPLPSTTMSTNNAAPVTNGVAVKETAAVATAAAEAPADEASPAHESLFGGSDAGSLFGETAGDDQPFGNDDDSYAPVGMSEHEGGMDHSADFAMADSAQPESQAEKQPEPPAEKSPPPPSPPPPPPPPQQQQQPEPVEVKAEAQEEQQEQEQQQQLEEDKATLKRSQSPAAGTAAHGSRDAV